MLGHADLQLAKQSAPKRLPLFTHLLLRVEVRRNLATYLDSGRLVAQEELKRRNIEVPDVVQRSAASVDLAVLVLFDVARVKGRRMSVRAVL